MEAWARRDVVAAPSPRYGLLGTVSVPYFLVFELLGPVFQLLGYPVVIVAFATSAVSLAFLLAFLVMALLLGVLLSVSALALEEFSFRPTRADGKPLACSSSPFWRTSAIGSSTTSGACRRSRTSPDDGGPGETCTGVASGRRPRLRAVSASGQERGGEVGQLHR
jgi:hypothetical protein